MRSKCSSHQGWWSRRLHTVHFFPKSKQTPFLCLAGKYQQTIGKPFRKKIISNNIINNVVEQQELLKLFLV